MDKPDNSPVTIADYAAQAAVNRSLAASLGPGFVMLGEETAACLAGGAGGAGLAEQAARALRESGVWPQADPPALMEAIDCGAPGDRGSLPPRFWTVDPIDGTKGFIRGGQYAVCVALVEHGQPTVGVLACPNLSLDHARPVEDVDPRGSLYAAASGAGVLEFAGDGMDGPGRRLPPCAEPAGPAVLTQSVEAAEGTRDKFAALALEVHASPNTVRIDSQCKYAVVARGQAHVYLRIPGRRGGRGEHVWDHASGALLVREAGCVVSDLDGKPLDFGADRLRGTHGILAAPAGLHRRMVAAAGKLGL